jgi:hypothetical protein
LTSSEIPTDTISSEISIKAVDAAGNVSAITTTSVMIDTSSPTVSIDTDKASLLLGDTAVLTFTLSELSNNNFGVDDISVAGGVLSGFTGSGQRYTALFVGDAESTQNAVVSIKADSFTDGAGNKVSITASANKIVQVDTLLPITINSVSLSADSGVSQTDFITNVPNQTVRGTLSRALLAGEVVQVSVDNGVSWNNANVTVKAYSLNTVISSSNTLKVRVKNTGGVQKALITQAYVYDVTISDKGVLSVVGDVWISREDKLDEAAPKFKSTFTRDKVSAGDKVIVKVMNLATGHFLLWESNVTPTEVERGFKEITALNSQWNDSIIAGEGVRVIASYVEDGAGNRSIISDAVQVLVTNDFTSLSSAVLNSLDAQLVENLPIGLLTEIANKAHIMNGLSVNFLSKLKADSISLEFLHGLTNVLVPVAMLEKLNTTQIGALPVEFFSSHFPIEDLNNLAQSFWSGVTPVQISYLKNEVVNKLATNIANNTHAINLTKEQVRAFKGNNDPTKASQLKSFFDAFYTLDLDNGAGIGLSILVPYGILNSLSSVQIRQLPKEIIAYCLPNLMSVELTNLNLLRIIGERSNAENVLLLPLEHFQGLLNNKLDAFLLPWVDSAQKENKNLSLLITQRFSAAQMSNISTNYPDILLKHMNVSSLTAVQLNGISSELLSYVTPEWISKINTEVVGGLSERFLNGLSDDNFNFLSHDFIGRISRSELLKLSEEKIRVISLKCVTLNMSLFTDLEMAQLNEFQLLAVFEGSVVDENGVERFADLTNVVSGLTAEKVRHVPWYILQGTIHNASMLERLQGEHVNLDSVIRHHADKYLSAKEENENSWLLTEATRMDNIGKMDEAIQQIKIALFNAGADAFKLLTAGTINKLSTLAYSPSSGADALDWESKISSVDYPIYSSVKELLLSKLNILTKDKVVALNATLIREFGKFIKDLNQGDLLTNGLNSTIQALSPQQLTNFFNQWAGVYPLPYVLEILSKDQIKTISEATLSKIMDVNHIQNQSNHFLRGLGERAKLLGTTLLNQEQINILSSRQLRDFLSAWQENGVYTSLPVAISGMLSSAKVGELAERSLKMVGERAGKIDIEIDLGAGSIGVGDKIQLWLDGRLWQVCDASRIDFAQFSIDLSQVKDFLGKRMLVRVLDKAGNLITKSSNLILDLNAVQNVSTSWLNSLTKENLVGNLSHTFLENLPAGVLDEYSEISVQFLNQIVNFGELNSTFLNKLSSDLITTISASQINLLSDEIIGRLGLDWDDVFTQIRSGNAEFDYVNKNGMEIELHLSQAVYLSDGKAAPQLVLQNGGIANYIGGSGTDVLRFKYIFSGNEDQSYFGDGFTMRNINMEGSSLINERGVKVNLAMRLDQAWIESPGFILMTEGQNRSYSNIKPLTISGNEDGVNSAERAAGVNVTLDLTGSGASDGDTVNLLLNGKAFTLPITKELTPSEIAAGSLSFLIPGSVSLEGEGHYVLSANIMRGEEKIAVGGNAELFVDTTPPSIVYVGKNIFWEISDASEEMIYTCTFNESIRNLSVSDFTISNGSIKSVTGSGRIWEVRVRAEANTVGEMQLSLLANRVNDLVGNRNSAYAFPAQAINTIEAETTIRNSNSRHLSGDASYLSGFHYAALLGYMLIRGQNLFGSTLEFDLDGISTPVVESPEVEEVYRFDLGATTWVMRTDVDGRSTFTAQGPLQLGEAAPVALDWENNTLTLEDGRLLRLSAAIRNIYHIYGEEDSYENFTMDYEAEVVIARTVDIFNFNIGDSVWESRLLENGEVVLQRMRLGVAPHADLMITQIDFTRGKMIFADGSAASLTESRFNWRRADKDTEIERGTTPLRPEDRIQAGVYRFMVGGSVWEFEVNGLGEQRLTQRVAGLDLGMIPVQVNVTTGQVLFRNAEEMNIADARLDWRDLHKVTSTHVISSGNYQFYIGTTLWHVAVNNLGAATLTVLEDGEDFGVRPTSIDVSTGRIYFADGSFTTVSDQYARFSRSPLSVSAAALQGTYRFAQQTLRLDRYGRGLFSVAGALRPNETPVEVNAETGVIMYLDGHTANMYDAGWVREGDLNVARRAITAGEYQFNVDGNLWEALVSSNGMVELREIEIRNNTGRGVQSMDVTTGRMRYNDGSSESILGSSFNWHEVNAAHVTDKDDEVEIGGSGPATNNLYTQVYMFNGEEYSVPSPPPLPPEPAPVVVRDRPATVDECLRAMGNFNLALERFCSPPEEGGLSDVGGARPFERDRSSDLRHEVERAFRALELIIEQVWKHGVDLGEGRSDIEGKKTFYSSLLDLFSSKTHHNLGSIESISKRFNCLVLKLSLLSFSVRKKVMEGDVFSRIEDDDIKKILSEFLGDDPGKYSTFALNILASSNEALRWLDCMQRVSPENFKSFLDKDEVGSQVVRYVERPGHLFSDFTFRVLFSLRNNSSIESFILGAIKKGERLSSLAIQLLNGARGADNIGYIFKILYYNDMLNRLVKLILSGKLEHWSDWIIMQLRGGNPILLGKPLYEVLIENNVSLVNLFSMTRFKDAWRGMIFDVKEGRLDLPKKDKDFINGYFWRCFTESEFINMPLEELNTFGELVSQKAIYFRVLKKEARDMSSLEIGDIQKFVEEMGNSRAMLSREQIRGFTLEQSQAFVEAIFSAFSYEEIYIDTAFQYIYILYQQHDSLKRTIILKMQEKFTLREIQKNITSFIFSVSHHVWLREMIPLTEWISIYSAARGDSQKAQILNLVPANLRSNIQIQEIIIAASEQVKILLDRNLYLSLGSLNWGSIDDEQIENFPSYFFGNLAPNVATMEESVLNRIITSKVILPDIFLKAVRQRSENMGWSSESGRGAINLLAALTSIDGTIRIVPPSRNIYNLPAQVAEMEVDVAWGYGSTGRGVKIGIIDVGFDLDNSILMGKVDRRSSDKLGLLQQHYHGVMVMSMITGPLTQTFANDGTIVNMGGVAPNANLLLQNIKTGNMFHQIRRALDWGANIISISIKSNDNWNSSLNSVLQKARENHAFIVVSAGNAGQYHSVKNVFARSFAGTLILAGATDLDWRMADYSNRAGYGEPYDFFVAPSNGLYSYGLGGGAVLKENGGSSTAAPLISSQIALLWEAAAKMYDSSRIEGTIRNQWIHEKVLTAMRETASSLRLLDDINDRPREAGAGAGSGRALSDVDQVSNLLNQSMSSFATESSFENINRVGTDVQFSNQPMLALPHG